MSIMMFLAAGVLLHSMTYDGSRETSRLLSLVEVTGLSSPSLSVAFYEPRVFLYDETINPAYPQMQPINRMDFIYGK